MKNSIHYLILLTILFSAISTKMYSQFEKKNWVFGRSNLNRANFNFFPSGGNGPILMNPQPMGNASSDNFGIEGTAVFTDPNTGVLKFYTDGNSLYNFDGTNFILTSTNLGADPSSSQPVAICPIGTVGNVADSFYVFCNKTGATISNYNTGPIQYWKYSLTNNAFSPTPVNIDNINHGEGMILVPNPSNPGVYSLITHKETGNEYRVYRVNSSGVTLTQTTNFGPQLAGGSNSNSNISNITYSSDFTKIAFSSSNPGKIFVNTFDPVNSQFVNPSSNLQIISNGVSGVEYDVEFSPNGSKLYFSTYSDPMQNAGLYQYNFNNNVTSSIPVTNGDNLCGGLKLGPDNKIYHISDAGSYFSSASLNPDETIVINRINDPDLAYSSWNSGTYTENVFSFPFSEGLNFPEFVTILKNSSVENPSNEALFEVYPNPTSDFLNITFNSEAKEIFSIELINNLGNVIIAKSNLSTKTELDIHGIASGIYYLKINSNNGKSTTKKILIK